MTRADPTSAERIERACTHREELADGNVCHVWAFRFPDDQGRQNDAESRRSILREAILDILSGYTGISRQSVALVRGALGKPRVASPSPLWFNASDSGNLGLLAISVYDEIGLDLEGVGTRKLSAGFARKILSANEFRESQAIASHERDAWLLRRWVAKEAALKLHGVGLRRDPKLLTLEADHRPDCGWVHDAEPHQKSTSDIRFFAPYACASAIAACATPNPLSSLKLIDGGRLNFVDGYAGRGASS